MFRLRQQIDSHGRGMGRIVGHDHGFGRARQLIDVHGPEHLPLGEHDEQIARPEDLVHARHGFGPIGHGGDSLGAAQCVDVIHSAQLAGA
jgi:hypothetical protein